MSDRAKELEKIVRDFCKTWEEKNLDAVLDAFAPDALYHNLPLKPLKGREEIRGFIGGIFSAVQSIRFEILDIFAAGGRVVTERVDHFDFGTARVALPIVGLFEFDGEGRIAAWREYFDLKTWYDQGGPPVE